MLFCHPVLLCSVCWGYSEVVAHASIFSHRAGKATLRKERQSWDNVRKVVLLSKYSGGSGSAILYGMGTVAYDI